VTFKTINLFLNFYFNKVLIKIYYIVFNSDIIIIDNTEVLTLIKVEKSRRKKKKKITTNFTFLKYLFV